MKYIYFLLIGVILYGCSASNENKTEYKDNSTINPCEDSLYLALKQKPPDSLTTEQKQYVKVKDNECSDYTLEKQSERREPNKYILPILGVVLVAVIFFTYLIAHG
jgi:hypothetical protein